YLGFIEIGTEMSAEFRFRPRQPDDLAGARSIEPHEAFRESRAKKRMLAFEAGDLRIEFCRAEFTSGQGCSRRPGATFATEKLLDLLQHCLRKPPVSRYLAAEYVEQWRVTIAAIRLQDIVARGFLRLGGAIVEKRPHARIGPYDIGSPHRFGEIFAGR